MRLRHTDKHGHKKHILAIFCSVILFFLQSSAQAANYLEGTAYNQDNRFTSFGNIAGTAIATYNFTTIDETDTNPSGRTDYFSIVIEGFIYASVDGQYEFQTVSDDGVRVKINDTLIINNWTNHGPTADTGTINLTRGWTSVRIENYEWGGGHRLSFKWKPPGDSGFSFPASSNLSNVLPPADPTNSNTTVVAAPTSVLADGSTTSTITVTLADASGNLLSASGGTVVLSSTGSATIGAVTDNGNGTYTATVTNTVAESVTISGTLDGANITDTATITFTVGAADPTNSNTTVVAAPTSVLADGSTTSTITVTLADASGNLLSASGGTVVLSSTGSATIGAVTDNGNGTYTATVTNTVAESVTISGTLDGANITDTATITFTVGAADPTNSNTTVVAAPTSVLADGSTTSTITVTLADASGNLLSASGGTVVLSSTGSATIGAVTDNGNGTYTATVTNTVAESVTISGTLDGANITDTATITFTVGAADPTNSNTTVVAAPTSVLADGSTTSTITVTLADASGNLLSASGGTVVLSSTGSATIGAVTDNGNGTYTATVTNTVAESVTISGTLDGANITDTATITFTVGAADPTNSNTTVVAAPTSVLADGSTTSTITVTLADASGNLLSASGGTVVLSSTGSATIGAVTDNGNGTYTATVTNTVAESVTISGTLDGANITDTATITFTVGAADPTNSNTTVVAAPTSVLADGSTTSTITVTLADASGNLLSASGGTVVLSSTGSATIGAVTDNGNGTYTATVTNTVAESVTISGTLDGANITDTATITFTVGAADPTNSNTTVVAAPTSVLADGSTTSTITVTLADASGNLLSASGGTVVLSSTGSATIGAVTDNGNGTYTATVTNTVAESVTISGTLDGANITDTATITFTVGAADPTNSNTTVVAAPTSVLADGSTTSTITVTLADASGNLLSASGGTVVLSSTGSATIGAVTDNGNGTYTATVTNTVAESVTISGTLDGANITDTATITFTVGAADPTNSNTTVVAAPTSVLADGSTTSTITVTLADASGNLLSASGGTVVLSSTGSATIGAVTDNGNGTYTATVTNTVAESVTISGTLDGANITDTATITFTVGAADPTNSNTTVVAAPTSVLADGSTTSTITVTLADASGNLLSASGGTVVLSSTGSATIGAVTDNGNGTYTATVTNTVAESVTISGTLDGANITDTATITFTVGAADPTNSNTTVVAAPTSVLADGSTTSTITVTLADASGNLLSASGGTVVLSSTGSATIGAVTDNGNGTYTATVTNTVAESVTISGTLDGANITDTATITFTVGAADPTNSNTTVVAAPTSVLADGSTTSTITVTLADASGNLLSASGGTVVLSSTGSATIGAVTDNGNGTYTATVTNTVAESVTISGTLDGANITDTATITFTVGAADPTNSNTTVVAAPTSVLADGSTTSTITVTLADASGNLLSASGGTVVLSSTGSATIGAVTDNGNGTYTATVTNTVAESVTISGTLDGANITDTATITFTVGAADPTNSNTTVVAAPTSVLADGSTTSTITVTLADASGNLLSASGGTVVLSSTGSATIGAVTDNGNGTYTATVTNTVAESVTISGTLDGANITDTATITFTVGAADPTNSNTTVVAAPTSVLADGSTTSTITVTLADASGNLLSASGGTVVLSSTGSATIGAVTDNGNGTYTATVTNTVAESVTISGTLDGANITDTATITFTDLTAPTLVFSIPTDNASNVELNTNIILGFSEDLIPGSGKIELFEKNGLLVESFIVSSSIISGSKVILNPSTDLKYNFSYYITIPDTAFTDAAGNSYSGITSDTGLNFTTRQRTLKESFAEVQENIKSTMELNTSKQIDIFIQTTKTTVSSARDRFISDRILNSHSDLDDQLSNDDPIFETDEKFIATNSYEVASVSSLESNSKSSFNLTASDLGVIANGRVHGLRHSKDETHRFAEIQFSYTKTNNSAETRSTSNQVIFEQEKSDDLIVGRFIGTSLSKHSNIEANTKDIETVINSISLNFGSYFVHSISDSFILDGYIAGSLLSNNLEVNTSSIAAEANYITRMGATGLAATGSLPFDSWEIRPTLAIDYSTASSQAAKFNVTSEVEGSTQLITQRDMKKLSFIFSPDIRKSLDLNRGYWSQNSILSFEPQVTCQRLQISSTIKHCGHGAALSLSLKNKNAMKIIFFRFGLDKIAEDTTYTANALYRVEF